MSDYKMPMIIIIFVLLFTLLSSFFFTVGDRFGTYLQSDDEMAIPFLPVMGGDNVEYDEQGRPISTSGDWWDLILGAILIGIVAITFVLFPPSGFITGAILLGGLGTGGVLIFNFALGRGWMSGIPIIGNIYDGLNYVATAMGSLAGLMFWNNPILVFNPLLYFLIITPILFVIFMLIIKIIRGN